MPISGRTTVLAVAAGAIVVGLSTVGGATAATLITGKDIKDRSIAGRDIKARTITGRKIAPGSLGTKVFKPSALAELVGEDPVVRVLEFGRATTVAPGATVEATADCAPGLRAVGGGWYTPVAGLQVISSSPTNTAGSPTGTNSTSWTVELKNTGSVTRNFSVSVLCLDLD